MGTDRSGGGACDGGRCFSGCGGASPVTLLKFAAGERCKHRVGSLDLQRSTAAMHRSGRGCIRMRGWTVMQVWVRVCISWPKILSGTTQHTARLNHTTLLQRARTRLVQSSLRSIKLNAHSEAPLLEMERKRRIATPHVFASMLVVQLGGAHIREYATNPSAVTCSNSMQHARPSKKGTSSPMLHGQRGIAFLLFPLSLTMVASLHSDRRARSDSQQQCPMLQQWYRSHHRPPVVKFGWRQILCFQ